MMRVIGDRVLVALPPEPDEVTTASGLVLVRDPDRAQTPTQGIVVALGDKSGTVDLDDVRARIKDSLSDRELYPSQIDTAVLAECIDRILLGVKPGAFDVSEGDCVLFPRFVGEEIEEGGIRYVILREADIIGIVEPATKETEAA